jgi:hypothetical protein
MGSGWAALLAENRIQEAMERGEFDHLSGRGKPLDLSDYFNTPLADRLAFSLLKSAGVVPPELQLLREAEELEQVLANSSDHLQRARLRQEIQAKRVAFRLALERRRASIRTDASLDVPPS